MNSTMLILFLALLGLPVSLFLTLKVLRNRNTSVRRNVYVGMILLVCGGSLLGGISVWWRMAHPRVYAQEPAPMSAQSQVILHQWDTSHLHVTRSSISGRDGSVQWSYRDESPCVVNSFFVLANGIIYQKGAIPNKAEVCVQASYVDSGKQLWSTTIHSSQPVNNLNTGDPDADKIVIAGNALYLQVDDVLYKLDGRDGKVLDKIRPDIVKSGAIFSNFASNDNYLVLQYSYSDGDEGALLDTLAVLRVSDDKVLWKSQPGVSEDVLAVQGDTLYVDRGSIVALRIQDGMQMWKTSQPGQGIVASSASNEHVYLRAQNGRGSADATIYTLSARDGRLLWKVPVTSWNGGAPTEDDGLTYIADSNVLSAFRSDTGRLMWSYKESPLPDAAIGFDPYDIMSFSQPVVVNGVVFVATSFVYVFPVPLQVFSDFCVGQCTPGSGIDALRESDGRLLWHYQTGAHVDLLAVQEA